MNRGSAESIVESVDVGERVPLEYTCLTHLSAGLRPEEVPADAAQIEAIASQYLRFPDALSDERIPLSTHPDLDQLAPLYVYTADGWQHQPAGYTNASAAAWIHRELQLSARSLLYWATHYALTIDEQLEAAVVSSTTGTTGTTEKGGGSWALPALAFIPNWPHIAAFFDAMWPPRDMVIEKSRDMMASWCAMATILHDLLFRSRWPVMTLSRLEALVDDGGERSTRDTLHGKIRFMYGELPGFMRVVPLTFKYLAIRNPWTQAHVTGFSATVGAGRGPKYKRAICDEFAWFPKSAEVLFSISPACPRGKYLISTPHGKGNAFYQKREESRGIWPIKELKDAHWERLTIHWSQHPRRDKAWYDAQCRMMTAEAIAQELDLNYVKALGGRVYSSFIAERHVMGGTLCPVAAPAMRAGETSTPCAYDPARALLLTCDWNYDPLVWLVVQIYATGPPFRVIDEILRRSATKEDGIREFVLRYGSRHLVDRLLAENPEWADEYAVGRQCLAGPEGHRMPMVIYGDATEEKSTVHNRVKTYQQLKNEFRNAGFDVRLKVPGANPPRQHRIETVNHALANLVVVFAPHVVELRKDCESGVWNGQRTDMDQTTEDEDGSGLTRSHASSALGYLLCVEYKAGTSAIPTSRSTTPVSVASLLRPSFVRGWQ